MLPFFHIYGMTVGQTSPCTRRHRRHDAALRLGRLPHLMQEHRVTFACVVPPIVVALAKHPDVDRFDLSGLRTS